MGLAACVGRGLGLARICADLGVASDGRCGRSRECSCRRGMRDANLAVVIHRQHPCLRSPKSFLAREASSRTDAAGVGPFYMPISLRGVGPFYAPITTWAPLTAILSLDGSWRIALSLNVLPVPELVVAAAALRAAPRLRFTNLVIRPPFPPPSTDCQEECQGGLVPDTRFSSKSLWTARSNGREGLAFEWKERDQDAQPSVWPTRLREMRHCVQTAARTDCPSIMGLGNQVARSICPKYTYSMLSSPLIGLKTAQKSFT